MMPAEAKWKTKDGTLIAVRDLDDSHLTNILRMLRRQAPVRGDQLAMGALRYAYDAPDGASDAASQAADEIMEAEGDELCALVWDDWPALIKEARRRKLPVVEDEHRPEDEERAQRANRYFINTLLTRAIGGEKLSQDLLTEMANPFARAKPR